MKFYHEKTHRNYKKLKIHQKNITVRQDGLKLSLENTSKDWVCSKVVPGLPEVNPQNTKEQNKR